uniref:Protein kinase domain-containing protein n=1 Tax=Panagrellus redivivus TaxID=6233 RepID=A0A7E4VZD1_PANRE
MSEDHRRLAPNGRFLYGRKLSEYEDYARKEARIGAHNYIAEISLGHVLDEDGVIVEENYLVKQTAEPHLQYLMHIIELKDEYAVFNTLREIALLKQLGSNKYIMTDLTHFRHRQYVCILHAPFIPFRNYLDSQMRFKESGGVTEDGKIHQHDLNDLKTVFNRRGREAQILERVGLFTRNAVAYILRKVIKGVNYIHSKGYAHTELCAHNVYLDSVSNVKVGGFLHLKKLGSTSWNLTSDPNCRPLEAFDDQTVGRKVEASVDYWGLGMLTLELITGQRRYLAEDKAKRLALDYLSGSRPLPTLGSIDKASIVKGQQVYDPDVDDFIARLLDTEPKNRPNYEKIMQHPFIRKPIDLMEAYRELKIAVAVFPAEHKDNRNLFDEMYLAQGGRNEFNEDLIHNVIQAIHHVKNQDYFIFQKPDDDTLFKQYIGIEASAAIPYDDANWSRDVLDQSNRSINGHIIDPDEDLQLNIIKPIDVTNRCNWDYWDFLDGKEQYYNDEVTSLSTLPVTEKQVKARHPAVDKNYTRHEIVFFVKKSWGKTERQVFTGMQFARWYEAGVIQFTDLIRLVDEVDEVIDDYVINKTRISADPKEAPDSVYFASPRRDFQIFERDFIMDPKSSYLAHVYVDVALGANINKKKFEKFNMLLEDDPTEFPPNTTPLQASVCFQDVDPKKFELLEAEMLGQMKVAEWEVNESQRRADAKRPESRLYNVFLERRRFALPVRKMRVNKELENEMTRDASQTKLWGDYARDYLFKVSQWAVPYRQKQDLTKVLYGTPFRTEEEAKAAVKDALETGDEKLPNQLARTKTKQEEDEYMPFKKIEDLDIRRQAADRYKKEFNGQPDYNKLTNQISRSSAGQRERMNYNATPKKVNAKWTRYNH